MSAPQRLLSGKTNECVRDCVERRKQCPIIDSESNNVSIELEATVGMETHRHPGFKCA
jgi:hypothetical protein